VLRLLLLSNICYWKIHCLVRKIMFIGYLSRQSYISVVDMRNMDRCTSMVVHTNHDDFFVCSTRCDTDI
jgi:hypothetical protein